MIKIKHSGDFKNTELFLDRAVKKNFLRVLDKYGRRGVEALSEATPEETGKTANAWSYEISRSENSYSVTWHNSNYVRGVPIAIILQYGHATRNGGFVQGQDYINPTMQPIFDNMAEDAWKEVTGQ